MTEQEKLYFAALKKDREENARVIEKPSMSGTMDSVVEKYSDQAHFIYELLQNADDANAKSAKFILEHDKLIFIHNGTRRFSISNPDPSQESIDKKSGNLGDVNAITSNANSNKTSASAIGKFGVGFKAIFQYTSTPHIYDDNFRFKIERYFVPSLLEDDFITRKEGETVFVFPFNHYKKSAKEAYKDISEKFRRLSYPLLFLSNLKEIEYIDDDKIGLYEKSIKNTYSFEDTIIEQICLTQNEGENIFDENLWLFSRIDEQCHRYSVGFFIDSNGYIKPVNKPAFCFFPTRENTNLNFIIHAPFLLTDSREGIRAGIPHNEKMIIFLANLASDALEYFKTISEKEGLHLINDNIVKIIPVDPKKFSATANKDEMSFLPFYNKIKEKLKKSTLLPSTDGYVSAKNAYWASVKRLPDLFSNTQLSEIVENKGAKWAFPTISRDEIQNNDKPLFNYINSLMRDGINEDIILKGRVLSIGANRDLERIKGISKSYIEGQTFNWLHKFYKWISETKHRKDIAKIKPFFLDQNGNAAAILDNDKKNILFLPVGNDEGYTFIHPQLIENAETLQLLKELGLKEPSLKDRIYNKILPLYKDKDPNPNNKSKKIDTSLHFKLFFQYYNECRNFETDEFISSIKKYNFLTCYRQGEERRYRGCALSMYMPTEILIDYFETKKSTLFIDLEKYIELVGLKNKGKLIEFLMKLGVRDEIEIEIKEIHESDARKRKLPTPNYTKYCTWVEPYIDGCEEILEHILEKKDVDKSIVLWNSLLRIIKKHCSDWDTLDYKLRGVTNYFHYSEKQQPFDSHEAKQLKKCKWLLEENGDFSCANNLTLNTLANIYDTASPYASRLLKFLEISEEKVNKYNKNIENLSHLTDSQREKLIFADMCKKYGIKNEKDLIDFQEFLKEKAAKKEAEQVRKNNYIQQYNLFNEEQSNLTEDDFNKDNSLVSLNKKSINKATKNVILDIAHRTKIKIDDILPAVTDDVDDFDDDELMPSPVDYSKKIERAKEKSAAEISKITYYENLYNNAVKLNQDAKYSAGWFKALLELESLKNNEDNAYSKEVSISFAKVEREAATQRTLILKHPNRYIPKFIEDLADIPLVLHMGDTKKTVPIEVMSIKSYTLRVKVKSSADIEDLNLDTVTTATIDAQNPSFLLKELKDQFNKLELEDSFNMRDNLCKNIEFIFGPPGTGKTTHIAQNIILPLMKEKNDCKILVLTPTNKAADVLVKRIIEASGKDKSYENWLLRFGGTGDEDIEKSPIFKDKTFDISKLKKNVTVSTIARFPYDFFMPQGKRIFLHGINWDYIIIDEASMIPIANIVFPLYKKTPKKFIIAGDPFQIKPITAIDLWKNENIYSMVGLDSKDSFSNPKTIPHQYKVELLTKQYRSIPAIGDVFSNLTYGGKLKHSRTPDSQRPLNAGNDLGVETLNIIKYPVSKYESIYRPKRLQHSSSYQVYSALFVFEYVCYLSRVIADNNPGKTFKIGIIAPYRAQADMIDKLFASEKLPPGVDVQVGTIHGFQGDECDIIFAVFNTPPTISNSKEMFLNKRNIINVSISRAKDYLFIVMPDDNTEGVSNLRLIKRVEKLMKATDDWNEFLSPNLEDLIFNDPAYLEKNAFSTSHQNVNVYGLPESRYEIRTEDNAVDMQIHKDTTTKTNNYE